MPNSLSSSLARTIAACLLLTCTPGCAATTETELSRIDESLAGLEPVLVSGTVLVLGELHGTAEAPSFVGRTAELALDKKLSVTVALEIPRGESTGVETFIASAGEASDRAALLAGSFWQSSNQDGRASEAMVGLLDEVRSLAVAGKPIRVVLFDKGGLGGSTREQAMAEGIAAAVEETPQNLTIVLTGNLHARLAGGGRISDPMAARAARLLARTRFVSLDLSHSGGTSWISRGGGYGIDEFSGRGVESAHVTVGDTLNRHGFHGVYHVGTIHASLPAVESRRVQTRPKTATTSLEAPPDLSSRQSAAPKKSRETTQLVGDWPQWMGPHGDGTLEAGVLPRTASVSLEIDWRQPIGSGYSSISITGDRAVTLERDQGQVWALVLDVGDGRELWRVALPYPEQPEDEPLESPLSTPTADGDRVFAIHPAGLLFALDAADGSQLWSHNLAREFGAVPPSYGMSTSPVLVDGRLFVLAGGREGHNLMAFDPATGETLTSLGPASQGSYATPVAGVVRGKRQLVVPAANSLYAIASDGGDPLWSHAGLPYPDRAPLLLEEDRVFVPFQEFGAMLEVSESGDVREIWRSERMSNSYSPAVHHAGAIYGFGGSRLMCLDVVSGETLWQQRLGEGSLVRVDDHLIVSSTMGGRLTLVAASPEGYIEKAALRVFPSGGSSFTPPSFGAGRIFLRGAKEIAAIRLGR